MPPPGPLRWESHCRRLYQLPATARPSIPHREVSDAQPIFAANYQFATHTFMRLRTYLGGAFETRPQECGWLNTADASCGAYLEYSVGWSFLRWLTDQYARQYPGGDAQFHREMLLSSRDQLGAIERLLGEPVETLLAQWSAALYVDDRVAGADPALQLTSWNRLDIYKDDPNRLIPQEIPFEPLERFARIRDGSTWYVRVSGDARPATALSVENPHNTELPDEIQLWVVRLE